MNFIRLECTIGRYTIIAEGLSKNNEYARVYEQVIQYCSVSPFSLHLYSLAKDCPTKDCRLTFSGQVQWFFSGGHYKLGFSVLVSSDEFRAFSVASQKLGREIFKTFAGFSVA